MTAQNSQHVNKDTSRAQEEEMEPNGGDEVAGSASVAGADRSEARQDWEARIGRRIAESGPESPVGEGAGLADESAGASLVLDAPKGLAATAGVGQITLSWEPVDGASAYLIYRSKAPDGDFKVLDHGGSDVAAVPLTRYADTGILPGAGYSYRVAAVVVPDSVAGQMSETVEITALEWKEASPDLVEESPSVEITVQADTVVARLERLWWMMGSERLAQLHFGDNGHGNIIGKEFADAIVRARSELGVSHIRSHGIFHDELGSFHRTAEGVSDYDFSGIDSVLDTFVATGVKPIIELSFMPADLAQDPTATVFDWKGIISPPADWDAWGELNERFVSHLVERFGLAEVRTWAFEVWNEANLEVFWTGTKEEYFRLYKEAAKAVKRVDGQLRVGGPATAASEWLEAFVDYVVRNDLPLDFISSHTYGNLPIHLRSLLRRYGLSDVAVWWTEWGVGSTHFGPIHDTPFGAAFVLRGLKASQEQLDALAYWVVSDHFEELGRPPRLFHNGFGLLSVGNLAKPRYWAAKLAAELPDEVVSLTLEGDGAGSLVDGWAARSETGGLDVLVWNATPNADHFRGVPELQRKIDLLISGLAPGTYRVDVARIDEENSNICRHLPADVEWPSEQQWAALRSADQLSEQRLPDQVVTADGTASVRLTAELTMPGVLRWRLVPQ